MKTVVRMPLLVRGQPVRNNGQRDIFVVKEVPWEIPEISRCEMSVGFSTHQKWRRFAAGMVGPVIQYDMESNASRFELGLHEGALYTRIATGEEAIRRLLDTAFPSTWAFDSQSSENEISFDPSVVGYGDQRTDSGISPVSHAVFRQLDWHRNCARHSGEGNLEQTWPSPSGESPANLSYNGNNSRNRVTFEDALPRIEHFDVDQYEACMSLYPQQLSRLLLVEGELWIKTPPPVYNVRPLYEHGKTSALVQMCLAPDYHETRMDSAVFSLSSRDEAVAYAHRLAELSGLERVRWKPGSLGERGQVYDATVKYDASDEDLLEYEYEAEELRRLSCALAVETRRFAVRNPGWLEKKGVAQETLDGIHASFDQVMETNYVTGEYGDASPWLESNLAFFKSAGRKHSVYRFGNVAQTDMMVERVRQFAEDAPIHIGLSAMRTSPKVGF